MKRYIEEDNRSQQTMFPERLDDYIALENQVRVIDAFVDELPLEILRFERADQKQQGVLAIGPPRC
jgi:transposase